MRGHPTVGHVLPGPGQLPALPVPEQVRGAEGAPAQRRAALRVAHRRREAARRPAPGRDRRVCRTVRWRRRHRGVRRRGRQASGAARPAVPHRRVAVAGCDAAAPVCCVQGGGVCVWVLENSGSPERFILVHQKVVCEPVISFHHLSVGLDNMSSAHWQMPVPTD